MMPQVFWRKTAIPYQLILFKYYEKVVSNLSLIHMRYLVLGVDIFWQCFPLR